MESATITNPEPLFKKSELVKLKSGSPKMWVLRHRFDSEEMVVIYFCQWLTDENMVHSAEFYECQLNKL